MLAFLLIRKSPKLFLIISQTILLTLCAFTFSARAQARLIKRYDHATSLFRVGEDLLEIRLEPDERKRKIVAMRICARDPLPLSTSLAAIDPFEIGDFLKTSPN